MWPPIWRLIPGRRRRRDVISRPQSACGYGFNEATAAKRRAYTLMELLLVLAIIVIAAAAAAPSMRRSLRNAAVKSAANDVRTALTRAHVVAMKTGRIHVFQYETNGTKYKIEPWIGDDDSLESKDGDTN